MSRKSLYMVGLIAAILVVLSALPVQAGEMAAAPGLLSLMECAPATLTPAEPNPAIGRENQEWLSLAEPAGPARVTVLGGVRTSTRQFFVFDENGQATAVVSASCTSQCITAEADHCVIKGCDPDGEGGCTECECVRTTTQGCTKKCKACKATADVTFINH